ncbi:MAG: polysaccharide (de)acetylase [Thermaurantimonas sp.]
MLNYLKTVANNLPGWHTHRKIIVIESDDWGSIRMPSREVYLKLLAKGYAVDACHYNRNDRLESNKDLELLFELLLHFKDHMGRHPVITANTIMCNPDFEKIRQSNFYQYYHETFSETLSKYPDSDKVLSYYLSGITSNIFYPQFHGREHVNIYTWLNALQKGDKIAREIFDYEMFTVHYLNNTSCRKEYLDSFGTHTSDQLVSIEDSVSEGLQTFKKNFGFESESFIATCYTWHPLIEKYLHEKGVTIIQSGRVQKAPKIGREGYKHIRHYTGQRNQFHQIYTVRNVIFEPSENPDKDWVDAALKEIKLAFACKKPAVVSMHRVNFIGSIHADNRSKNLKLFQDLLKKILQLWPDVEFMNTAELGRMMMNR